MINVAGMAAERFSRSPGHFSAPPAAGTAIATRTVSYRYVDTPLTGVLMWDRSQPRPERLRPVMA
jgi:hypothetical protein